jgi:hypothetical protein
MVGVRLSKGETMLKNAGLQKRNFDITRRGGHETYSVRPDGAGASSRAITQTGGDPEIARLVTASKAALAEVDRAEKSGSPSAISAAKAELRGLMTKLESARVDALQKTAVGAMLRAPMKLNR